jgi:2-methylisocitrate lyase-like PEP mutase family enzyme
MAGIKGKSFTVSALSEAGVKRVSLTTSLYRVAMTAVVNAATEVARSGTFGYLDETLATPALNAFMIG